MKVKLLSRVQLFATPWSGAHQVPPSMGFSWQEYWSGVPLISPIRLWSSYQMTRVPFCSSRRLDALSGGSPQEGLVRWDTGFPWIFWSNSTNFHQNHTLNSSHLGSGVQDFPFLPCGGIRAVSARFWTLRSLPIPSASAGTTRGKGLELLERPPSHPVPASLSVRSCHQGVGFTALGGARPQGQA